MANRNFTQFTDSGGSFPNSTSYLVGYTGTDEKRITVTDFFCNARPLTAIFGDTSNQVRPWGNNASAYRLGGIVSGFDNTANGFSKYIFGYANVAGQLYGNSFSNNQEGVSLIVGAFNRIYRNYGGGGNERYAATTIFGMNNILSGSIAAKVFGSFNNIRWVPGSDDITTNADNAGMYDFVAGNSVNTLSVSGRYYRATSNIILGDSNTVNLDGNIFNNPVGWASDTYRNCILGFENTLTDSDRTYMFGNRNYALSSSLCFLIGRDNRTTGWTGAAAPAGDNNIIAKAFLIGEENLAYPGDRNSPNFAIGMKNQCGVNGGYFGYQSPRNALTIGFANTAVLGYVNGSFGDSNITSGFYTFVIGQSNNTARDLIPNGGSGWNNSLMVGAENRHSGYPNNTLGNSLDRNAGCMFTLGFRTTGYGNQTLFRGLSSMYENCSNGFLSLKNSYIRNLDFVTLFGSNLIHSVDSPGKQNLFGVVMDSTLDGIGIYPMGNGSERPGQPGIRPFTRSNQATLCARGGIYIPAQGGNGGLGLGIDTMSTATSAILHVNAAGTIIFANLPTSSAGLPSGALWSNSGVLTVVA